MALRLSVYALPWTVRSLDTLMDFSRTIRQSSSLTYNHPMAMTILMTRTIVNRRFERLAHDIVRGWGMLSRVDRAGMIACQRSEAKSSLNHSVQALPNHMCVVLT
jgi:hypothetical protein